MKRLAFIILCVFGLVLAPLALAQEDGTSSAEIRRIQEYIQQTLQKQSPEGRKLIGVLGSVVKVSTSTFTLVDSTGRERTVQVNDNTDFLSGNKTIGLKDLSINSGIVAIGRSVDEIVIDAARVLVSDTDFTETRRVFVGTITQWDRRSLTIEARGTSASESFTVNSRTAYQDNSGAKIAAGDIQTDQSVLLVARDDGGTRIVTTLRLLAPLER